VPRGDWAAPKSKQTKRHKSIGNPSATWCLGCTQEQADQAPGGAVLRAWGGAAQAPDGAVFAQP